MLSFAWFVHLTTWKTKGLKTEHENEARFLLHSLFFPPLDSKEAQEILGVIGASLSQRPSFPDAECILWLYHVCKFMSFAHWL